MADGGWRMAVRATPSDPTVVPSVGRWGWPGQLDLGAGRWGWPGRLVRPGGAAARGVGTRPEVPGPPREPDDRSHARRGREGDIAAGPDPSCRFATRTGKLSGPPGDRVSSPIDY